jgi:hypothetical protein
VKGENVRKILFVASCVAALCLSAASCGIDSTSGHPVRLHTELVAADEFDRPFETETGWTVRIDRAAVSLGALYYFDGEPAFVERGNEPLLERFAALFRTPIARAHPGHYIAGTALGQMVEPVARALRSEPSEIGEGNGLTGLYRSARFVLAQDQSGLDELAGNVAMLQGRASKDGVTVYFKLSASFADVARSVSKGEINGCLFDETEVERDGTVTVTVKPRIWLDLVDFADVAPGSAAQPTEIAHGELSQIAFALGVVQLSAYHFSFTVD